MAEAFRKLAVEIVQTEIACPPSGCGHTVYVTADHHRELVRTGKRFWCTVCGSSPAFTPQDDSKLKELQKKLADATRDKDWYQKNAASERAAREKSERSARALRAAATRTRNRIKNGVCPCCNRTFSNLLRHMHTEHPEFNPGAVITGEQPPVSGEIPK